MTHAERVPAGGSGQDTAAEEMGHAKDNNQAPNAQVEYHHDKREVTLYHSDLNDDILKNPALYIGPAAF